MKLFLGLSLLLGLSVSRVMGCSCGGPGMVKYEFAGSQAVFLGEVVRIEKHNPSSEWSDLAVTLQIEKSWKGTSGALVKVVTAPHSAACGFPFRVGQRYLVYGHQSSVALHTDICTRTKVAVNIEKEIAELNTLGSDLE